MLNDLKKILLTFTIGLSVGFVFKQFHIPAPYLVGSLFGTWLVGSFSLNYLERLTFIEFGIPRWFHKSTIVGLSVLIGASFSPEILANLSLWTSTVVAMLLATVIATLAGYYYLHRWRHYDKRMAMFCSLPGGQAEIIAISRDLIEKDYVVAFCHLVRVVLVVSLVPILLAITQGREGVAESYVVTASLTSVLDLSWMMLAEFLCIGVGGYFLATWIRIPIPHLLGPLLLSSGLHLIGWVAVLRINEFILLAQVTIGGAVGAKLAQIQLKELFAYFWDAVANAVIVISIYCAIAVLLAQFAGIDPMKVVLAFIPGGIYEVTVLALVFGFDVAFVAFHHTIRVLLIFLCLPFLVDKK